MKQIKERNLNKNNYTPLFLAGISHKKQMEEFLASKGAHYY